MVICDLAPVTFRLITCYELLNQWYEAKLVFKNSEFTLISFQNQVSYGHHISRIFSDKTRIGTRMFWWLMVTVKEVSLGTEVGMVNSPCSMPKSPKKRSFIGLINKIPKGASGAIAMKEAHDVEVEKLINQPTFEEIKLELGHKAKVEVEQARVRLEAESELALSLELNAWENERTSLQLQVERLHHEVEQNDSACFIAFEK
ncbi:hypothetical protein D8674_019290 [Pyrus ussuriensis x Pyrus communis]|uniref:Uncharacterized protein n=1 Tax=Pyrus ussuriensis x Pyrus communis TaxID=2448454 RepID=A0A5N5G7L7_9ROSA|nr:hypothetical protein D8674_019290 [Pyrus ussuriensis x Pyrus communis]